MAKVPTYFSHSYRPADQAIHKHIWSMFAESGLYFAVDPPSPNFSSAYLEALMLRSSAFVAVVPHRPDGGRIGCSPYIWYECALAMRARKPRILLLERGIVVDRIPGVGASGAEFFSFDRNELDELEGFLTNAIHRLSSLSYVQGDVASRRTGRVGLLLNNSATTKYTLESRREISAIAESYLFDVVSIELSDYTSTASLIEGLQNFDVLILDVSGEATAPDVFALVYASMIPSIKLRPSASARSSAGDEPVLTTKLQQDGHELGIDELKSWANEEELYATVQTELESFQRIWARQEFRDVESGMRYFANIGRASESVFISVSSSDREVARELSKTLDLLGIENFFYKNYRSIESGESWPLRIRQEVARCGVFVALIGPTYFTSPWCILEWQMAEQRAEGAVSLRPYVVADGFSDRRLAELLGDTQAPDLRERDSNEIVSHIAKAVDTSLRRRSDSQDPEP